MRIRKGLRPGAACSVAKPDLAERTREFAQVAILLPQPDVGNRFRQAGNDSASLTVKVSGAPAGPHLGTKREDAGWIYLLRHRAIVGARPASLPNADDRSPPRGGGPRATRGAGQGSCSARTASRSPSNSEGARP